MVWARDCKNLRKNVKGAFVVRLTLLLGDAIVYIIFLKGGNKE